MKRNLLLYLLLLFSTVTIAQTTWTGGGVNENWNNTDNWDTNLVPTITDDVIIPTGSSVLMNSTANVKSITIQGTAIVTKSSALYFTDPSIIELGATMICNNGNIYGSGSTLTNNGIINTSNSNIIIYEASTITNYGTINMLGTGDIYIATGSVINNMATGVIDIQANNSGIVGSGAAPRTLNNYGLLKTNLPLDTDQATISIELKNLNGVIQVEKGVLNLNNSAVDGIELTDGTYNVFANAALDWDSAVTLIGTLTGNLIGEIVWRNAVRINNPNTVIFNFTGNQEISWVSGNLTGGGTLINNNTINLQTSNVYLYNTTTLTNNGNINFKDTADIYISTGSIINNTATGIIDFQINNSGISGSGAAPRILNNSGLIKTSFPLPTDQASIYIELKNNNGTIQVESGILNLNNSLVNGIELTNGIYNVFANAALEWDNSITLSGNLTGNLIGEIVWRSTVRINNPNIATFNFTGNQVINWAAGNLRNGGTLINNNILKVNTSNVYLYDDSVLTNNNKINFISTGDLYIATNSILNNSSTGVLDFQVSNSGLTGTGAAPRIVNNTGLIKTSFPNITDVATISLELKNNDGTIQVENGILNLNNSVVNGIELTNGTYNVFANGTLDWTNSITASGTLEGNLIGSINWHNKLNVITPNTAIFNFTGNKTINLLTGNLSGGGTLVNESIINKQGSNAYLYEASTLINNGNIHFTSTGDLFITTNATLTNTATGVIDFLGNNSGLTGSGSAPRNLNNAGLLKTSLPLITDQVNISVEVTNTGIIEAGSGILNFSSTLDHQANSIMKGVASINLPTAANFTNNGIIAPGSSPGILTAIGNYTSTSNTILDVELNGLVADTEYDVLAITGTNVVLEGAVNVTLGFDASIGDSFIIATTTGTISTKNLVSPTYADFGCKQFTFDVSYPSDNSVLLTISDKRDVIPPVAVTQNITAQLDASGNATITAEEVNNGSSDNCTLPENLILALDITSFTCANLGPNTVTLTVTDEAGLTADATAVVTVEDAIVPTVVTQNQTVQLDANGNASITINDINNGSSDNCTVASMSLDITSFTCANLGTNTVTLTVTDQGGLSNTETATVTVEDAIAPTAVTQNQTVQLDTDGNASITANDIDNGSSDNCTVAGMSLDITSFTCANLGPNTVILTVTDQGGLNDTETATVTVEDAIAPTVVTQNQTVQLDANGNASITANDIDNGSSDNCTVASISLDITSFTCANLGPNTVTLTVTDQGGLSNSDTATVTVEDAIAPTVVTQNQTVQLDANGNASITANDINNGSSDNCTIASMSLDVTSFTCANLGSNTVTLTVTDQGGLSNSETATVTVEDAIAPAAITQNITVPLDANGDASITANDINNGSTDNCTVASMSLDITSFTCDNLGPNTVILTVTDQGGLSHSAPATVTLTDTTPPELVCPDDLTVSVPGGNYTVPNYFQNGVVADDNCDDDLDRVQTPIPGTVLGVGSHIIRIEVTDDAGNYAECTFKLTVEETLGVDDQHITKNNIMLFPNPVTNNVTLKNNSNISLTFAEIIDVSGAIIQRINLKNMSVVKIIDFSDYASGIYFVKIASKRGTIVKQLIKQ
ncbi:MAG: HYR domain-containing protein [Oceanihabitans sp.]